MFMFSLQKNQLNSIDFAINRLFMNRLGIQTFELSL